jgi:hypothetical protein
MIGCSMRETKSLLFVLGIAPAEWGEGDAPDRYWKQEVLDQIDVRPYDHFSSS